MLHVVTHIDDCTVDRLMAVYAESMDDLRENFANEAEMYEAYKVFLKEFAESPRQLILVEVSDDTWVSAMRAIGTTNGSWFLEAVETRPDKRGQGYGTALLRHTIEHLRSLGMRESTCTIAQSNHISRALHEKCGFSPTDEPPLNCWGELEEGTILYRLMD